VRYGVIADVHGNLDALRVVLAELRRHKVHEFLVAGDLVGYGPHPNECVEEVALLGARCVAGNHDLIVLGELSDHRCIRIARESLRWTSEILNDDARRYLGGLPARMTVDGRIVLAHGSLDDPQEYTTELEAAASQLARVREEAGEDGLLVLGHTHRPLAVGMQRGRLRLDRAVALPAGEPVLLNPGAVGQSRELRARARCVVLDLDRGEAQFLALRYDVNACRAALRRAGLAPQGCHLPPASVRRALRHHHRG
jgi:predicted phosphodiesterase